MSFPNHRRCPPPIQSGSMNSYHPCVGGSGTWRFGQGTIAGVLTNTLNKADHNILPSLVDWVEGGKAPDAIVGTDPQGPERKHCLWPKAKSV